MTLRIFASGPPAAAGSDGRSRKAGSEPLPIFYDLSQHKDEVGPYVDTTIVWNASAARLCRRCPKGECNLSHAREGLAICTVRKRGILDDVPVAVLPGGLPAP